MLEVRKYHLERYVSQYTGEGSSITDRFAYKALCKAAASEPDISIFTYRTVVGDKHTLYVFFTRKSYVIGLPYKS